MNWQIMSERTGATFGVYDAPTAQEALDRWAMEKNYAIAKHPTRTGDKGAFERMRRHLGLPSEMRVDDFRVYI